MMTSKKLGEIMVEQGTISEEDIEDALQKQADGDPGKIGEVLIRSGKVESRDVAKAIREQKISQVTKGTTECRRPQIEEGIRVSVDKLDSLVDMVGELVIAQIQVASSQGASSAQCAGNLCGTQASQRHSSPSPPPLPLSPSHPLPWHPCGRGPRSEAQQEYCALGQDHQRAAKSDHVYAYAADPPPFPKDGKAGAGSESKSQQDGEGHSER